MTPFLRMVQSFVPTIEGLKDHVRVLGLTLNHESPSSIEKKK